MVGFYERLAGQLAIGFTAYLQEITTIAARVVCAWISAAITAKQQRWIYQQ